MAAAGFLSIYLSDILPHLRRHIAIINHWGCRWIVAPVVEHWLESNAPDSISDLSWVCASLKIDWTYVQTYSSTIIACSPPPTHPQRYVDRSWRKVKEIRTGLFLALLTPTPDDMWIVPEGNGKWRKSVQPPFLVYHCSPPSHPAPPPTICRSFLKKNEGNPYSPLF